ncbi:MAG TPA: serine protease [Gemmatimonadaceae bacterium]|nr:serine protease [Gemmatimonadaceae bacterium]
MRLDTRAAALFLTLAATASRGAAQQPDPRNLVVMLEWRDHRGETHRGAGVILDQGAQGTLIVTAKHNVRDPVELRPSRDMTAEFRVRPGTKARAEVVHLSAKYDVGLVRVQAADAPEVLGKSVPADMLNLQASGDTRVFVVGFGGGVAWSHNVVPVPARFPSVADIAIESSEQLPGQSGGGVFDRDWALIGMVIETAGSTARALPIGLILDEVRTTPYGVGLAPSAAVARQTARRDLASRNISWSAASVADALASADLEVLGQFLQAGAPVGLIAQGFSREASGGQTVAHVFFERTRGDTAAAAWLRSAIRAGLDPNATVPSPTYAKTGLLNAAIYAGNATAALALMEGGASPHALQELWFARPVTPPMLFPFDAVIRNSVFTREEKRSVIAGMFANGGIFPSFETVNTRRGETYHTQAIRRMTEQARAQAGVTLSPNDPTDMGASPVCRVASRRDGFDWCAFARAVPRGVRMGEKMLHDFWHLDLVGLIGVVDGKAYFLGLEKETYGEPVSLVEVSRDMRAWRVYRYMSPQAAMGFCKEVDGQRPDRCWRRINMTYDPTNRRMMVEDYYPYSVVRQRGQ